MTTTRRALAAALGLCVACGGDPRPRAADSARPVPTPGTVAASAGAPAPLGDPDFAVDGVKEGLDTAAVRRLLGAPDSVSAEDNPFDPDSKLREWRYRDLVVDLTDEGVYGMTIVGPGAATARGLRVGDPADRVRTLYGAPAADGDEWEYPDPRDPGGLHVVRVSMKGGRVARIFVGSVLD